jgi:hypothetical protein
LTCGSFEQVGELNRCHMVNPLEIMPVLALALMIVFIPLWADPP